MLRKLESLACFFAAMLAIVLEAACVYWLWTHNALQLWAGNPLTGRDWIDKFTVNWTSPVLPQVVILVALLVMVYRVGRMLVPQESWDEVSRVENRRAFVRLWFWGMTLTLMQGLDVYLEVSDGIIH